MRKPQLIYYRSASRTIKPEKKKEVSAAPTFILHIEMWHS